MKPTVILFILSSALGAPAQAADRAEGPLPGPVKPAVQFFDLASVRLLESPFKTAQETDHAYLLSLEPDRLLSWYRKDAGLTPKAEVYGGPGSWETLSVAGHTLGHYLSACSQMYAATGDRELLRRVRYIVEELAACQQANGGGYIGAIPTGKTVFRQLKAGDIRVGGEWGSSGLNGTLAPWYVMHKELAGLLDASTYCHDGQALAVAQRFGDWMGSVVGGLSRPQMQTMLQAEHGGMTEALANLSALAGQARYLDLAERFRDDHVFVPLAEDRDILTGLHANTQIPKFVGYQRVYELTGDPQYLAAAQNFWSLVTRERSFVIGGDSENEHFFPADRFEDQMTDTVGPESCNSYNMLKLTEHLFEHHPDGAIMDYYEKTLYNHILSTIRPGQGGLVYYTSMSPGSYRVHSTPFSCFWCCVGTGMENHAKYGQAIYAHAEGTLLVNLFIPSRLEWSAAGLSLTQTGDFPNTPRSQLGLRLAAPKRFTLAIRYPGWTSAPLQLAVNGVKQPVTARPGQYAEITRLWRDGDRVSVELPMALHIQMLPHSADYAAVLFGPIVLAGRLGAAGLGAADFTNINMKMDPKKRLPAGEMPRIAARPAEIPGHLRRMEASSLTFRSEDLIQPHEVTFVPFYQLSDERYAVYWKTGR